jgi:transposase-like protein
MLTKKERRQMSKYYDEQFKKEVAKEYLNGRKTMELVKKYRITKSSIYEWSRKYSKECQHTTKKQKVYQQVKKYENLI